MTRQQRSETELQKRLKELKAFKEKHGYCDLWDYRHSHQKLWNWCTVQRGNRKNGMLSLRRRKLLDEIGFDWDLRKVRWERRFKELKAFKRRYGHCWVPRNWKENPRLSLWVSMCRYQILQLSEERKRKLNSLGFDWGPSQAPWYQRYEELRACKEKFGRCREINFGKKKISLEGWIRRQSILRRKGLLSNEKIWLLDRLGFEWNPKPTK